MDDIQNAVYQSLVKKIASGDWLTIDYSNKISLPKILLQQIYDNLDKQRVMDKVKEGLEELIAKTIVNNMATEMNTDVKSILCNKVLRQELRDTLMIKIKSQVSELTEKDK